MTVNGRDLEKGTEMGMHRTWFPVEYGQTE